MKSIVVCIAAFLAVSLFALSAAEPVAIDLAKCAGQGIPTQDADTLRCYFTSEDPGKRQSQMWYRDFDLRQGEFVPQSGQARIKWPTPPPEEPAVMKRGVKPQTLANKAIGPKPEVLYNGIELPLPWPPPFRDPDSAEAMPVPYLKRVPKTIPIDVGRQLFVDDFLIETTTLNRTFHQATKFEGNPVFKAETERELGPSTQGEAGQQATVYTGHGGVFYDPAEKHFKMFYVAGWRGPLSLATRQPT